VKTIERAKGQSYFTLVYDLSPGDRYAAMNQRLDDWCGMAEAARITGLAKFVKTLQAHRTGICAYADHPITTWRLEAGNVSIALLRRRARGFRDMEYFKLKILQLNTKDTPSFLYNTGTPAAPLTRLATVGKP
jgi:transposase